MTRHPPAAAVTGGSRPRAGRAVLGLPVDDVTPAPSTVVVRAGT
ncbi:hypothetical protein [Actinoplanes xinjiangensis]|nr:hypothetical protein [Actinoplanes xinjiangensis]